MKMYRVTTDELYHHGIKGQKWYVRRYQNEDGTLTEAGKARYGNAKGLDKETLSRIDRKATIAGYAISTIPTSVSAGVGYNVGRNIGGTFMSAIVGELLLGGLVAGAVTPAGKNYVEKLLITKEFANKNPDAMNTDLGKKYAEDILNNRNMNR